MRSYKITLLIIILSLSSMNLFSKDKIAYYTLFQTEGTNNSNWIGIAIPDLIKKRLDNISQLSSFESDLFKEKLGEKKISVTNPSNIDIFTTLAKENSIDFIITGTYEVKEVSKALNVKLKVHNFKTGKTKSINIGGYSNDVEGVVAYLTERVIKNFNIILNSSQLEILKTGGNSALSNEVLIDCYKGENELDNGNYNKAVELYEKAYRSNIDSKFLKEKYDKALSKLYGDGMFILKLIETDKNNISSFRKQYLLGKKIALGYKTETISYKLVPVQGGKLFDLEIVLDFIVDNETQTLADGVIKSFEEAPNAAMQDGVYNPSAVKYNVSSEEDSFEKNIGNTRIYLELLNDKKESIYKASQSFRNLFDIKYKNEIGFSKETSYKRIFNGNKLLTTLVIPAVNRDIIKNTLEIKIKMR